MKIATWNLNNRVGMTKFRPDSAIAATSLGADVLVFNEYYPKVKTNDDTFRENLKNNGYIHQEISIDTGEVANRVLIASKESLTILPYTLKLPDFDQQFPSNILCVQVPSLEFLIIGIRVPWYQKETLPLVQDAWNWIETTAASLKNQRAIILGDLNAGLKSQAGRGGEHFRRILQSGWHRAEPSQTASFMNSKGQNSAIDHALGTKHCSFSGARYIKDFGGYSFAGKVDALSDHAALMFDLSFQ